MGPLTREFLLSLVMVYGFFLGPIMASEVDTDPYAIREEPEDWSMLSEDENPLSKKEAICIAPVINHGALNEPFAGVIQARLKVGGDGSVYRVELIESAVPPGLVPELSRALIKWKFFPAIIDGTPYGYFYTARLEYAYDGKALTRCICPHDELCT